MPKVTTNLRIFLSSPKDLIEERINFRNTIDSLNQILLNTNSDVRLELVMWETDTYPSMGNDAQSFVNEQIGDDYDIFVGLMWTRFGTPTPRAGSGTEEEFNQAFKRLTSNSTQTRILFYFKDSAPDSLSKLDPKQLEKVSDFKGKLQNIGLLGTYRHSNELPQLIQNHLLKHIKDFRKTWGFDSPQEFLIEEARLLPTDDSVLEERHSSTRYKQAGGIKVFPSKKVYARIDVDDDWKKEFTVRYPIIEGIKSESVLYKINSVLSYEKVFDVSLIEAIDGGVWLSELDYKVNLIKRPLLDLTFFMEGVGAYCWGTSQNVVANFETGQQLKANDLFKDEALERLASIVNEFVQIDLKKALLLEEIYSCDEIQIEIDSQSISSEDKSDWIEERFSHNKFEIENLNHFSINEDGIYFIYDFGFPHVIKALEPEGRYYFPFSSLKQLMKENGIMGKFIQESISYER